MTLQSHSWKNMIQKDTCIPMFIAALFTIAKTWKQPTCPLTEEWIKRWGIHKHWLPFHLLCSGKFPPGKGSKDHILELNSVLSIVVTAGFNNNKSFLYSDILLIYFSLLSSSLPLTNKELMNRDNSFQPFLFRILAFLAWVGPERTWCFLQNLYQC